MAINLKAKETLIQVGEMKGQYRFILGTELYNKLSESKVIKEAAIRSGVSVGVMQVCWDAAGEVIKAWCTEGHSVAVPGLGTMRFGVRAKSVPTVGEVATSLITNRRVIFTPSVDIKRELQETSIQITCYDRNGKVVKTLLPTIRAMWKTQTTPQVVAVRITPRAAEPPAVMRATVWSKKRAPDARKRASGAFILLHYIEDGCIELHHENVEKKAGRQEADALIHRIINLTDALDALAHDAVTHAHHHDRETDVRNETMRERTRKEGSYGIQQNGMGQEGERQHDTCRDAQLDEHQAQGRALAILGMVEMEHSTLPYHPDGDADEHQPYEPYRGEMVYKMARKPADALGAGKRMGERLGHRSCKQPRNQNHHYFGYSQQ